MFYELIKRKCDEWIASSGCTVRELVQYIYSRQKMRDAQIEAIKIYLFLKIACGNKPLWRLFADGVFNSLDLNAMDLTVSEREAFRADKAAAALLEYSLSEGKNGKHVSPGLEQAVRRQVAGIDYVETFRKIFYGIDYTDYIFSLPMGAGKTYLMAAFIYLDLYFAQNEPGNQAFAHNFMIMVPSGLKSSIIPSLKHIQEFDPTWVVPDPSASMLKRMVKFEILDEQKAPNRSNLVKNPNAQKINYYQPLEDLMGLVAVTNAEKVILDRAGKEECDCLFDREEQDKVRLANELRDIIGEIPHLSVFIDEVHHAADGEIKLRQVVSGWTRNHSFCGVLGFSGTPYLEKAEHVALTDSIVVKSMCLSNVVCHYPLVRGVGNFLKVPEIKYADNDANVIVGNGVKDFFDKYLDTVYCNGACAKLAVYCGRIDILEEKVYPQVARLVTEYGLKPTEAVLKYHCGNSAYPQPDGSEAAFASLDMPFSRIRVVLLVQIGKEGWDCKSLTGVILPQKGACRINTVLQTSCRCLRQVGRNTVETALVWLNKFNADILNKQLKRQQNLSLQELNCSKSKSAIKIERFKRTGKPGIPTICFYQLKVSYQASEVGGNPQISKKLSGDDILQRACGTLVRRQNLSGQELGQYFAEREDGDYVSFYQWLLLVIKESFNTLSLRELKRYEPLLANIFCRITTKDVKGNTRYDTMYDQEGVRSLIRKAFAKDRKFVVNEDIVLCQASLLRTDRLVTPLQVDDDSAYYPSQKDVKAIIDWDANGRSKVLSADELAVVEKMKRKGIEVSGITDPHPERLQTYHYLPYRFGNNRERCYFIDTVLPILDVFKPDIEIYFTGESRLAGFKIDCYKHVGGNWRYVGKYVPSFLILSRKPDGSVHRVVMVDVNGGERVSRQADCRKFVETDFIRINNERFGYNRFCYLYLYGVSKEEQYRLTLNTIHEFFKK